VLFGVITDLVAFWSAVVLAAGVLRGWPVIALDRGGRRSSGAGRLA